MSDIQGCAILKLFVTEISRGLAPTLVIPVSYFNIINIYCKYLQENFGLLERFIALI